MNTSPASEHAQSVRVMAETVKKINASLESALRDAHHSPRKKTADEIDADNLIRKSTNKAALLFLGAMIAAIFALLSYSEFATCEHNCVNRQLLTQWCQTVLAGIVGGITAHLFGSNSG